MRQLKNFAAAALVMLLCTVVFGVFFTSCTNSEDVTAEFTPSQKTHTVLVPVEKKDTVWYPVHDTIRIEIPKALGISADGEPELNKVNDEKYLTVYPIVENGTKLDARTNLDVWAKMLECDHDIIVVSDSIIPLPHFEVARSTKKSQDGDFSKISFRASWTYNFGSFSETIETMHQKAWYKGWEMLSSYWLGGLKEVRYGAGKEYQNNGVDGRLFENTFVWQFVYNNDDVRTFAKTHRFFVAKNVQPQPQPQPQKQLVSVAEKSFDGSSTYVITRYYADGSMADTVVVNSNGYKHSIELPTLARLYRDNTNFGNPTIAKNGAASETNRSQIGNLIFSQMLQKMTASYSGHSHNINLQYTALAYTEDGKSCELTVPMWSLSHNNTSLSSMREETENNRNYEVTPVSFIYNAAFGNNSAQNYNTDTEVWKDKGAQVSQNGTTAKNFGFDYVNPTTSYTYATFYAIMSDGTEKELGTDGVQIFNSIEAPASQSIDTDNFNISDANAVEGSKQLVSTREAAGKYGKFIVKKYKTTYTTRTNKAQVVFVAYHEEAEFVPTIGDSFAMTSKTYSFTDLGSSSLVDLGRKNGKNGKMYKSQISASFNGRSTDASAEVNLWVTSPNKFGIASASQSHTWDYNNAHHVASIFVYNIYDEGGNVIDGGLKGFIDGKEVVKASWDEVNAPSGIAGLAQQANGTWIFCNVSSGQNSYTWRSMMKANNNQPITSIDVRQLLIQGYKEVLISSASVENSDGSVTVSSASGSATAAAW